MSFYADLIESTCVFSFSLVLGGSAMRPPCNPGMADGEEDISASRFQIKLIISGTIKETCIFNPMRWVSRLLSNNNDTDEPRPSLTCALEIE